jgi:hypothetical protein
MPQTHLGMQEIGPRFPSGPWTGFFLQYWFPGRHTTKLELTAAGGELTGEGRDWVGPYTMDGSYDLATGHCEWTKRYLGKHQVRYRGTNDGHGIWGVWEIRQLGGLYLDRGGFHIWPEGSDVSEESERTEQAVVEIMRKEFGNRMGPVRNVLILALVLGIAGAIALTRLLSWHGLY